MSQSAIKNHPRNYFQKTGIGEDGRRFGTFDDINWTPRIDEHEAARYCTAFLSELTRLDGYLDTAFSTHNPILRAHPRPGRLPFRAVLGISSGADSSMTAEVLCRALAVRYKAGIRFPTDQILLVSFRGTAFNGADSEGGMRFGEYLKQKYPMLPIVLTQIEVGTDDYTRLLEHVAPLVPDEEVTTNVRVSLDFHKPALLNQVAEAYNFLLVETTNLTEEALGETADGTGGYGHLNVPVLPKSFVYRTLDHLGTPEHLGRNSVDTCTKENKMRQYIAGECPPSITTVQFFDVIDRIILMFLSGHSADRIIKETGHTERFVQNTLRRIHLALHREKLGGYPFTPEWRNNFRVDIDAYRSQFHDFASLQNIFNIEPKHPAHSVSTPSYAST